jgi:shikimate kinase
MTSVPVDIDRTIVLVGLMGAGKTCVGRRLAHRLRLPFIDADEAIADAAGATVTEIFAAMGEAAFRDGERRVIARLLAGPPQVLATGGGAFVDPATRALIRERGISVWLRASLDVLDRRTRGRGGRPLLEVADPRAALATLLAVREPIYAQADVVVDTSDEPADFTTGRVLDALLAHLARRQPTAGAAS